MTKLTEYIIALTNLYGMVHKDQVLEIYNSQNAMPISSNDVEKIYNEPTDDLDDAFVYTYKDYFVHEVILEYGEFELYLNKKAGKPHYVPKKNELLKYVDECYFEKSKEYIALLSYVKKNFYEDDEEEAEWLCEDIHGMCKFEVDIKAILSTFENKGIRFEGIDQVQEVTDLIADLANSTRIWENNGCTPKEIFEKFEKPNLSPLPDEPFNFGGTVVKKEKIGRNDPCPCGSGKKYKKCCLGKK